MNHYASSQFWNCYHRLPEAIRDLADRCFVTLKADPGHPSLRFKRISATLWSARVGLHYRALGRQVPDGIVWQWVGSHADYDQLIRRES